MTPLDVSVAAATDQGRKRAHNEDSHGVWVSEDAEERRRRGVLLVVADGMGGLTAGEVASGLAVRSVLRTYRSASGDDPLEALHRSVETANQVLHEQGISNPALDGMGTTCTAVVVHGSDVLLSHVGDSRAYLLQSGRLRQLSTDHSVVAQLVRDGQLSPEQAKADPRRNVVTRSVGLEARVEVDDERLTGVLGDGDTLVLCSDGLHGQLTDDEIAELAGGPDLERACQAAVDLANQRGGPDNITVMLARVSAGVAAAPRMVEETLVPATDGSDRDPEITAWDGRVQPAGGAATASEPDDDLPDDLIDEPAALPPPAAPRLDGRAAPRRKRILLRLIIAVLVLLLALIAIALVWGRLETTSERLGSGPPASAAEVA